MILRGVDGNFISDLIYFILNDTKTESCREGSAGNICVVLTVIKNESF